MFKIEKRAQLTDQIFELVIHAPRIAKHCEPGQFVALLENEDSERIPLTISDYDREAGTITVVVQAIGCGTCMMSDMQEGDSFAHVVGPLGKPSDLLELTPEELEKERVLFVAGGVGAAPVYPQVKWCHENGVACDVILGARTEDILILEDELRAVADNVYVATDDGSYGLHGLVTDVIHDLVLNKNEKYSRVVAIGPMIMMKFAALKTKELGLKTIVSMNPIMVDGTGMCGACRLTVGDEVKFACVDGPEFDGHLVDFNQAMERQQLYKSEEGRKLLEMREGDTHHGNCGVCR